MLNNKNLLTSWVSPDKQLADFIVDPYQDGKWYSHKPVLKPGSGRRGIRSEASNHSAEFLGSLSMLFDVTKRESGLFGFFFFLI